MRTWTDELQDPRQAVIELQEIIEGSFDGILVTDGEGNVLMVNDSYVRYTDLHKEEMLGHNVREHINPVWMKDSVALLAIRNKKTMSMHHTTKHGKNIMVTGAPIFGRDGRIKKVVVNVRDISEIYQLREELSKARVLEELFFSAVDDYSAENAPSAEQVVAVDAETQKAFSIGKKVANFNTTVLITGESGVGKDVLAQYIHRKGALRCNQPFIAVNCGAIPDTLLESELFGYEDGAFSGAKKGGRQGLIEASDGGTLFLDEISEMKPNLQVKLLRVLEDSMVTRIGAQNSVPVDFRVIAATNKDLKCLVQQGLFREDLFYRLSVVKIEIRPLRERGQDIIALALRFIRQFNSQYHLSKKITYEVLKEMEEYDWPGNIRELRNTIESMMVLSDNEYLQLHDLPWIDGEGGTTHKDESFEEQIARYEKKILTEAKRKYGTSRNMAAVLKIDQSTIIRKMKKLEV
jgi:PAS domain S-box-containing protein